MKMTVKFITNSREELDGIIAMVEKFGVQHGVPPRVINDVNLALDEILSNVIRYGYDRPVQSDITVQLTLAGDELTTEIEDEGKAFNPLTAPEPDLSGSLRQRKVGGLGLHFVKSLMDEVDYRRLGQRNLLVLRKRLPAG